MYFNTYPPNPLDADFDVSRSLLQTGAMMFDSTPSIETLINKMHSKMFQCRNDEKCGWDLDRLLDCIQYMGEISNHDLFPMTHLWAKVLFIAATMNDGDMVQRIVCWYGVYKPMENVARNELLQRAVMSMQDHHTQCLRAWLDVCEWTLYQVDLDICKSSNVCCVSHKRAQLAADIARLRALCDPRHGLTVATLYRAAWHHFRTDVLFARNTCLKPPTATSHAEADHIAFFGWTDCNPWINMPLPPLLDPTNWGDREIRALWRQAVPVELW